MCARRQGSPALVAFATLARMNDDQRRQEAKEFAAIVLGLDGVSEEAPPAGSTLATMHALAEQYQAEGRSGEELAEAYRALWQAEDERTQSEPDVRGGDGRGPAPGLPEARGG